MSTKMKPVLSSATAKFEATMLVEVKDLGAGAFEVTCPDADVPYGQKNVKLRWEMVTPNWEIIGIDGLYYPEFIDKSKDGYDYKCKDKNPIEQDYKYTIAVRHTTTNKQVLLDPTIRNGGN